MSFCSIGAVSLGVGARKGCGRGGGRSGIMSAGVGRPTVCGMDAYRQSSLLRSRPRSLGFRACGDGDRVEAWAVADGSTRFPSICLVAVVLLPGNVRNG